MEEKRAKGRPRLDTEPVNLRLPREMIEALDSRRRHEADLPTRPEMIRRLLVAALDLPKKDLD
jgi:hypothetical protein